MSVNTSEASFNLSEKPSAAADCARQSSHTSVTLSLSPCCGVGKVGAGGGGGGGGVGAAVAAALLQHLQPQVWAQAY